MFAYSNMQEKEFANEKHGFRSAKHQGFVGTGYFTIASMCSCVQ